MNRYSLIAAIVALAIGLLWRPGAAGTLGLVALALSARLIIWDSERDEIFSDDWSDFAHVIFSFVFLLLGGGLIVASIVG